MKFIVRSGWIVVLLYLGFINCSHVNADQHSRVDIGYNFEKPDLRLVLPDTLREISGLTYLDSATIACVQDENGILFIYDISTNAIRRQYAFTVNGDYEGIARVQNELYILRSDGVLLAISNYKREDFSVASYATGIPADNNEGLCYDSLHNRLLIGCKSRIGKGPELKDKRAVYAFELATKKLSEFPLYLFDVGTLEEFAADNKIEFPSKKKKKGNSKTDIKMRISAIGIHPLTQELYILSASDHALFVFDPSGKIRHIEKLNDKVFNKAEGITFAENGDMFITNEAQDKKPTLLKFTYNK